MTQPKFAPISVEDEVRPAYRTAPPTSWLGERPAELRPGVRPLVHGGGVPGPDQGYALLLAARLRDRLVLAPGEHADDVVAGAVAIGLRRAALYGRAPVSGDIELPLVLFGFLGAVPEELVEARGERFAGVHHDYARRRALAESVPESTLRSTPAALAGATGGWRELAGA